jgi:hypothetical protein
MQILKHPATSTRIPINAGIEEKQPWITPTFDTVEISEVTRLGGPPLIPDGLDFDLVS